MEEVTWRAANMFDTRER
jgi:hypothetical protein